MPRTPTAAPTASHSRFPPPRWPLRARTGAPIPPLRFAGAWTTSKGVTAALAAPGRTNWQSVGTPEPRQTVAAHAEQQTGCELLLPAAATIHSLSFAGRALHRSFGVDGEEVALPGREVG